MYINEEEHLKSIGGSGLEETRNGESEPSMEELGSKGPWDPVGWTLCRRKISAGGFTGSV